MIQTENTKKHYSKKEKIDREQTTNILTNKEVTLIPARYLNEQGKEIFEYMIQAISESEIPFDKVDETQLNLLAESISQTIQAVEYIHEHGVIDNGKKNPAIMVYNSSLKNVNTLMTSLNLSMNQRVKMLLANIQNQNVDDPFRELIAND